MERTLEGPAGRVMGLAAVVGLWSVSGMVAVGPRAAAAQSIMSSVGPRIERTATVTAAMSWPTGPGCKRRPSPVDTIEVLVSATLESPPGRARLPQGYALDLVQAATATFRLPRTVRVGVFAPDTVAVPALSGAASFAVDSAGRVEGVRLSEPSSATPVLDTALLGAITRAAAAHTFPRFPAQLHESSVEVTVAVSSVQWSQAGDTIPARIPLFSIAVPVYERLVRAEDLQLPEALSLSTLTEPAAPGERGPVLLEYVVDARGVPEARTIRVVEAQSAQAGLEAERLFSAAVLSPAMVGRCPVPQLMRLPVQIR